MAVKQVPINDELNAMLEAQAKLNKRSKTKELESILEAALAPLNYIPGKHRNTSTN